MSSIPYNYGSYIDAKVSMTNAGTVDSGKQMQSPASAGSRGLAKTTQFTNDRTQMQMGNSPIAESMVEIRNILNRIDGVNAPVQEKRDNSDIDIRKLLVDISSMKDRIAELAISDDAKTSAFTALGQVEEDIAQEIEGPYPEAVEEDAGDIKQQLGPVAKEVEMFRAKQKELFTTIVDALSQDGTGLNPTPVAEKMAMKMLSFNPKDVDHHSPFNKESAHVQEDDMQDMTISDLEAQLGKINDEITFLQIDQKDKESALAALGELRSVLDKYQSQKESADSGELGRLKELSGIEEDAGLTDEQKKGLEAIAKKYNDREGGNGRSLPMGHIQALTSSGITTDGYDLDEMEAYAKKIGKDWSEWEDKEINDFLKQAPITSGMIDDMIKVLGPDWEQNENLYNAAIDVLDTSVPFPEGDEFNIEEDEDFEEVLGPLGFPEDETELFDAEYRGRKVPLNKPMRGDVKKFKVYVKDPKSGNVKKVNFGHGGTSAKRKTMRIRKSNPKARKSFRARHNCANPGPKTKARYWSCRKW